MYSIEKISTKEGEKINPFFRITACLDQDDKLFIMGGETEDGLFSKAFYLLDLENLDYSDLTKIDGHTCIFYNSHFYIYGGNDSTSYFNNNKIYKIKISPFSVKIDTIYDSIYSEGSDEQPIPRCEHISQLVQTKNGPYMIIHGGRSRISPTKILGDIWSFHLGTLKFKKIGDFCKRCCHTSSVTSNGDIIFFGGKNEKKEYSNDFNIISFSEGEFKFKKIEISNKFKMVEMEKSSSIIYKNNFIVIGGWKYGSASTDIYTLNLKTKILKKLKGKMNPICAHISFIYNEVPYMIGGKYYGLASDYNENMNYSKNSTLYFKFGVETLNKQKTNVFINIIWGSVFSEEVIKPIAYFKYINAIDDNVDPVQDHDVYKDGKYGEKTLAFSAEKINLTAVPYIYFAIQGYCELPCDKLKIQNFKVDIKQLVPLDDEWVVLLIIFGTMAGSLCVVIIFVAVVYMVCMGGGKKNSDMY